MKRNFFKKMKKEILEDYFPEQAQAFFDAQCTLIENKIKYVGDLSMAIMNTIMAINMNPMDFSPLLGQVKNLDYVSMNEFVNGDETFDLSFAHQDGEVLYVVSGVMSAIEYESSADGISIKTGIATNVLKFVKDEVYSMTVENGNWQELNPEDYEFLCN